MVKELSGEGEGSAEWVTSMGNKHSQTVPFGLTCEESTEKLEPVCRRVLEPVPKMLYMNRGCCRAQGPTAWRLCSSLGMVVHLDTFHWIHRFDAAIRKDAHSKYTAFKSASWGSAGLQPHRPGAAHQGCQSQRPAMLNTLSDEDVDCHHISREQLKHHMQRFRGQCSINITHCVCVCVCVCV